ncbi:ABC transporter substrate-binding protein [Streptantibioticus cattleyicolor]|uniref:ABC transporter binding protein n=1 Tax=Streptantibioticus cattleyicolor (strain ATCC 35852 / DSM 46488 / JCM 4925 / NBRC 14057 / NRRL 8057) TaxID=1003195 RepID=F8JN90_STREN|nr:ABC transporter substrate-binding protein [Streptantibioticus cattleyicolor]AEW99151.1 ABC transporter binding protein [Streptantibioticus cattleyicolor NRRL 8057 = DSM 46488]CCB71805.1 putative spermidine/putrescine transporter subunit; periplasmic-binding component of ABC superfamily transporter [Streptantibioticus cattleyicolor NRRL 8057 = DSM 46488]
MPKRTTRALRIAATACTLVLAAACGSGGDTTRAPQGFTVPKLPMQRTLGPGEGQVDVIAWAGYAEDGSDDPKADWVHPFEKRTGCTVHTKIAGTSDEMVSLMKTGQYDTVSASGDATLRLIAAGDAAPVNTALVPNYRDVFPGLKEQSFNSVRGQMYGIPHGRGANLLMYRTDTVRPAPDSWSAVFDGASRYRGHVTAYDSPISIADAALYLMSARPSLHITNPYALDEHQLAVVVELLRKQHQAIGEYWSDYQKEVTAFKSGDSVIGTTWQVIANLAAGEKAPVKAVLPKEGATGWSDTWMVSAKAKHPNCAYRWLDWIVSPEVNAEVAEFFGEAPANAKSCALTTDPHFCATYHAADETYYRRVHFWTTPVKQCLDGRKDTVCTDYAQWSRAWTQIKG